GLHAAWESGRSTDADTDDCAADPDVIADGAHSAGESVGIADKRGTPHHDAPRDASARNADDFAGGACYGNADARHADAGDAGDGDAWRGDAGDRAGHAGGDAHTVRADR